MEPAGLAEAWHQSLTEEDEPELRLGADEAGDDIGDQDVSPGALGRELGRNIDGPTRQIAVLAHQHLAGVDADPHLGHGVSPRS